MVPVWAAEVDKWESLIPNVDAYDVTSKMDAQTVQRSVRNWRKRRGGIRASSTSSATTTLLA